ncbi:general secretion pathway protein GspK [Albitalea terrae]|uniref:Type II secretion system protein K n=2 Tax=Piscinibacter terrae TaxID=2496871 RepID=A0A3N7HWU8_9BURK|nr:general secretion pathway protein GspK [Albitalea terrae]
MLTAMIIVALIATLAASMVWQQWRAVQIEVAERSRMQSSWILSGALDWAKLILKEDAKSGGPDHLGEPWAVPLAEARLSTFLAADKDNTDEGGPEAFLSGSITDVQSRYNLRNLVDNTGKIDATQVAAFKNLLRAVNVGEGVADRIADGLRQAIAPMANGGSQNGPLMPREVSQLTWLGIDDDSIKLMKSYVTILPVPTPVNANTASAEALLAAIPGLDRGTAQRIVQSRQRNPFKSPKDVLDLVPEAVRANTTATQVNVSSSFFEVRGRLRLSDRVLEESSLVERQGTTIVTLSRQRENSRDSSE